VPRDYALEHASSLIVYAALGGAAALLSHAFYTALLGLRAYCRSHGKRLAWAWPGLGGLVTGVLAVSCMWGLGLRGVTGDGYATLSAALRGELSMVGLATLLLAKFVATTFCYATGGAGGLFAPVLFMGAMLGGGFGRLDHLLLLHSDTQLGAFALVGMGALFAAVIRAPITSVLIIFEMTGSYELVLPLMIANSAAYVLARRLFAHGIYEALLEQDGLALPRRADQSPGLAAFRVGDAMTTQLITLAADDTVHAAAERVGQLPYSIYPVLDSQAALIGLISEARIRRRLAGGQGETLLREHARALEYLRADEPLLDAVVRMNRLGARQMVVVAADGGKLLGMLAMSDVMRAHVAAAAERQGDPNLGLGWGERAAVAWQRRDSGGATGGSATGPSNPVDSKQPRSDGSQG
jgi:CIC family chloride channel protein